MNSFMYVSMLMSCVVAVDILVVELLRILLLN